MIATTTLSPRVVAVARMLARFSPNELSQLIKLVPSLRVAPSEEDAELAEHFRQLAVSQNIAPIAADDEPFIGGLTYAQYFALSEVEQNEFWEQLFTDDGLDLEAMPEADVITHANLSTR